MKKILSVLLTLCLFVNVSFAFDPYADEEVEKKSYKKLYYGIALTLLGGFLAYDGFSLEKVDTSKPSVDYLTVSHSEYVHNPEGREVYQIRSGVSLNNVINPDITVPAHYEYYEIVKKGASEDPYNPQNYDRYTVEKNVLYNNGNVDLTNITIEVRYRYNENTYIGDYDGTAVTTGGYHTAGTNKAVNKPPDPEHGDSVYYDNISLKKGESITWQDIWEYRSDGTSSPNGSPRSPYFYNEETGSYNLGRTGLDLGKDSTTLMDVRVVLNKNDQYKPIYQTKHKSDLEGVAGIFVGITGIYFIVDHFLDMHKFNAYAKRHHLNLRIATASNEYKLMLQKRI